nr:DUF2213 domain-containing protein [Xylella fastidiosa]
MPARFARTGIQHYAAHELGVSDADPQRVIRVYRPLKKCLLPRPSPALMVARSPMSIRMRR